MSNVRFIKALKEQVPSDAKQVDIYLKDNVIYFVNKDEKKYGRYNILEKSKGN